MGKKINVKREDRGEKEYRIDLLEAIYETLEEIKEVLELIENKLS